MTPAQILELANKQAPATGRAKIAPHIEAIKALHAKGWSGKKIAAFLAENGVKCSDVGIYAALKRAA